MAESIPERAAQQLAEVDERIRRGAELTLHRRWWWYVATWSYFALLGAGLDVPAPWRPIPTLLTVITVWISMRSSTAHPLTVRVGWRAWLWVLPACGAILACGYGAGLALRSFGVPMPFTGGGLLLGVVISLVAGRIQRLRGGYVDLVRRGRW